MAENLLTVDVVDISIPPLSTKLIPFIEEPNPVTGYSANGDQIEGLLHFANCIITVSGTNTRVTGENFYDYFPEKNPGPGPSPGPGPDPDPEPTPTGKNVPWGYAYPTPVHFFGIVVESVEHD